MQTKYICAAFAIFLAALFGSGNICFAESLTPAVAAGISKIYAAIVARDARKAAAQVREIKDLPDRTKYDDFKIAEAEVDSQGMGKSSRANVLLLQRLLASPLMQIETAGERNRYTENLVVEEGDLFVNAADQISRSKGLIRAGYHVDGVLHHLSFAYFLLRDYPHTAALATILRERERDKGEVEDKYVQSLFSQVKGKYSEREIQKDAREIEELIASGRIAAGAVANEKIPLNSDSSPVTPAPAIVAKENEIKKTHIALDNCTTNVIEGSPGEALVKSFLEVGKILGNTVIRWDGSCEGGVATGPGTLIRVTKMVASNATFKLQHIPDGFDSFTNDLKLSQSYLVLDMHTDEHFYGINKAEVHDSTRYYDLSTLPDWAQHAMASEGRGSVQGDQTLYQKVAKQADAYQEAANQAAIIQQARAAQQQQQRVQQQALNQSSGPVQSPRQPAQLQANLGGGGTTSVQSSLRTPPRRGEMCVSVSPIPGGLGIGAYHKLTNNCAYTVGYHYCYMGGDKIVECALGNGGGGALKPGATSALSGGKGSSQILLGACEYGSSLTNLRFTGSGLEYACKWG